MLVCNGLGIYCGMKTLEWLSLKTYKWQGLWNIPTYKYGSRAALVRGGRNVSPTPTLPSQFSSSPTGLSQRPPRSPLPELPSLGELGGCWGVDSPTRHRPAG